MKTTLFDLPLYYAFLKMAEDEGLLKINKSNFNEFYNIYDTLKIPHYQKTAVLEQFMVSDHVLHIPDCNYDALSGYMIDNGIIVKECHADSSKVQVDSSFIVPIQILASMLENRRFGTIFQPIREDEIISIITAATEELDSRKKEYFDQGKEPPSLVFKMLYDQLRKNGHYFELSGIPYQEVLKEDERRGLFIKARRIKSCYDDFEKMMSTATASNAYIKVAGFNNQVSQNFSIKDYEYVIVKISAAALGRFGYCPTLKATLNASQNGAVKAFREKLSEWNAMIENGSLTDLSYVEKEARVAEVMMKKLHLIEKVDDFYAYIGLPVFIAEILLGHFPLSVIVGGYIALQKADIKKHYKWAMFN